MRPIATGESPFPDLIDNRNKKINRHFVVTAVSIVMLIPFIVTTALDVFMSLGMSWSAFVLGAEALFWLAFVLPFQSSGTSPYMFCIVDTAATALYVFLVYVLTRSTGWYLPLALPIILASGLETCVIVFIHRRRKIGKLTKFGCDIFSLSFFILALDVILANYLKDTFLPQWSWYASVPLFALGLTVIVLSMNSRFTEWLRKKMFV